MKSKLQGIKAEVPFWLIIGVIIVCSLAIMSEAPKSIFIPEKSELETKSNDWRGFLDGRNDRRMSKNLSESKIVLRQSKPKNPPENKSDEPEYGERAGNGSFGPQDCPNNTVDKYNMSCWSCSSLVMRICYHLFLYGLPRSWEDELWDDCASGYCGIYEWTLDYGAGTKIVQRECVEGDPQNFCVQKKTELQVINTTVFGNCTTCKGHLCNKQNPSGIIARELCFHIFFPVIHFLQYKYFMNYKC